MQITVAPEELTSLTAMSTLSENYIFHIVRNQTTQDATAVCSIVEYLKIRTKTELPELTDVLHMSDNARCYQNNVLPVVAPFIEEEEGFTFRGE